MEVRRNGNVVISLNFRCQLFCCRVRGSTSQSLGRSFSYNHEVGLQ